MFKKNLHPVVVVVPRMDVDLNLDRLFIHQAMGHIALQVHLILAFHLAVHIRLFGGRNKSQNRPNLVKSGWVFSFDCLSSTGACEDLDVTRRAFFTSIGQTDLMSLANAQYSCVLTPGTKPLSAHWNTHTLPPQLPPFQALLYW